MRHLEVIKTIWKRATISQYDEVVVIRFDYMNEADIYIEINTETNEVKFFGPKNTPTDAKIVLGIFQGE